MNLIIAIIITDIQWLQSVSRDQVAFLKFNFYNYITTITSFIFVYMKMIINTNYHHHHNHHYYLKYVYTGAATPSSP